MMKNSERNTMNTSTLTIRTTQDEDNTWSATCEQYPDIRVEGYMSPRAARISLKQYVREAKAAEAGR